MMMMMTGPDLDSDDIDDVVRAVAPALVRLLREMHAAHIEDCGKIIAGMQETAEAVRSAADAITTSTTL